jgi:raffinose/stachyose/melibiose transport system substrate-binding protein
MKGYARTGAFILVCVFLLSLLSACGQTGTSVSTSPGETTLSKDNIILTIESSQAHKIASPMTFDDENFNAFSVKYPNITIEQLLIPDAQAVTVIQTKLASGEPSDIIVSGKNEAEIQFAITKNFVDLSNEAWVPRLRNPDFMKSPDGKFYGFKMEIELGGECMVYNTDIFTELNLSIPTSYAKLLEICEKIKAAGILPIFAPFKDDWTFQIWTSAGWGYVASVLKPGLWDDINSGKTKWADVPEFELVLQRGYDLFKLGYMQDSLLSDDYNMAPDEFSNKKCAMMIMGDWFVNDMAVKDPSIHMDAFSLPIFDEGNELGIVSTGPGQMLFIPKKAKHVAEAKLLLDFLSQPEQMNNAQKAKPFFPTVSDANDYKLSAFQQNIVDKYISKNKTFNETNVYMKVDMVDLWKYFQDMFAGEKTPKQVIEAWDVKFAELMKAKGEPGF